ncbi:hypothetical protein [Marinobacter sp. CA1]|uniref:hypothetical protein n=1 Tax=Marinobacter sp. CA1 TaxID=2817656 RepID=UPI001D0821BF|nr:hypothetical protein [Marinobacter sp. CA1]UDL03793.1 hypothetical protein J2887_13835 [Marinobacter sp. CA1]
MTWHAPPNSCDHRTAAIHFLDRLENARIALKPYPHFYIDQVFPDEYYATMLELLPTQDAYRKWTDVGKVKLEQYSRRDQCYLEPSWLETQPPRHRRFWQGFAEWFLSEDTARRAMTKFETTLTERFLCQRELWPTVYPQALFLRHRSDYFIGPHTDIPSKIVNILLYLPEDDRHEELGTSMFAPKQMDFSCPGTQHHQFEDFHEVDFAPYRRNTAFGFVKTDNSWHGVKPISEASASRSRRDVIQYMVYDNPMRAPRKNQTPNSAAEQ